MQHPPLRKVAVGLPAGDPTYVQGVRKISRTGPEVRRTVAERNVDPREPVVGGGEHSERLVGQEFQEARGSSRVFLLNDVDHLRPSLEDVRTVPADTELCFNSP